MDQNPKPVHPKGIRKGALVRSPKHENKDENKITNPRIIWSRGLTTAEIGVVLQGALLEARAARATKVELLSELVHEIKYRLTGGRRDGDDG